MTRSLRLLGAAAATLGALVAACSSSDGGSTGGGPSAAGGAAGTGGGQKAGAAGAAAPVVAAEGGIGLAVSSARGTERNVAKGRTRVTVDFEIANGAKTPSLPLAFLYFSVQSSDGIAVKAIRGSDACPDEASLVAGTSRKCSITADLIKGASPVTLHYEQPVVSADGKVGARTADAPIAGYVPCKMCDSVCVDLNNDDTFCGTCDTLLGWDGDIKCVGGKPVCPSANETFCPSGYAPESQPGHCADLQTEESDCGACGRFVAEGVCQKGMPSCYAGKQACPQGDDGIVCESLDSLSACGECGKSCDFVKVKTFDKLSCKESRCYGKVELAYHSGYGSCQELCDDYGFDTCLGTEYYGSDCSEDAGGANGSTCFCDAAPR